jgi:hypothetical protein
MCLKVNGNVVGCHDRARSPGSSCDGADCCDDEFGVEVERVEQEVV